MRDKREVYDEDLCLEENVEIFMEDEIDVEDQDHIRDLIKLPGVALVLANLHQVQHVKQAPGHTQVTRAVSKQQQQSHVKREVVIHVKREVVKKIIYFSSCLRHQRGLPSISKSVTLPKKFINEELIAYADNDKTVSTSSEFGRSSYSPAHSRPSSSSTCGQNYERSSFSSVPLVAKKRRVFRRPAIGMTKPCNCTQSQGLKLYRHCFVNGSSANTATARTPITIIFLSVRVHARFEAV